jgi:hypothetical protein
MAQQPGSSRRVNGSLEKKGGYGSSSKLVTKLSPPPRTPAPGGKRPAPPASNISRGNGK